MKRISFGQSPDELIQTRTDGQLTLQTTILIPVIALVGWTLIVVLLIPYQRFRAVRGRTVTASDFKFGESSNVPGAVSIPNRNYMNLLEMPLLFYVVCLVLYVTQKVDSAALILAWIYVTLRMAHSLIHLTYNNVIHRLYIFATSSLVLTILWARTLLELVR